MFKKVFSIFTTISIMILCFTGCGKPEKDDPVSIIFATDTHYLSPELTDGGEYFKNAIAQGDGKVVEYSSEINDAFFAEVIEKNPDLLILGGDLTLNGALQSHKDFIAKLEKVQSAGIGVLVIPGNHDVDNENAIKYLSDGVESVEALTSTQFFEYYNKFGHEQALTYDENSFSYMYMASENLRIIMLDSNCYGKGFVKESTLEWLKTALEDAKNEKADIITVTHQNLFAHSTMLSFGYQLYNANELLAILEEYKVKLNLSGHIHIQNIMSENGITEIATSSLEMAPIQYGELTYDGNEVQYSVQKTDVSAWADKQDLTISVFEDFEKYSTDYFEYTSRLKVESKFDGSSLTMEETALLADTFAKANTYYFSGEKFDPAEFSEGVKLIESKADVAFYKNYINSILETAENEKRSVTVKL